MERLKSMEKAQKIHLYKVEDVLRPRGSMKKESLGELVYDRLMSSYESWTDSKYGDNPDEEKLLKQLKQNLTGEIESAWNQFISDK